MWFYGGRIGPGMLREAAVRIAADEIVLLSETGAGGWVADHLSFHTGETGATTNRPTLTIKYSIP